jgi:hypothetical protein
MGVPHLLLPGVGLGLGLGLGLGVGVGAGVGVGVGVGAGVGVGVGVGVGFLADAVPHKAALQMNATKQTRANRLR